MRSLAASTVIALLIVPAAFAQNACDLPPEIDVIPADSSLLPEQECPAIDPGAAPFLPANPWRDRISKYSAIAEHHRLNGLASYYSAFFDGRKTANGEIYRHKRYSAAHLTLPLGSWVEVTARATGKKLRLRVNDRGPYAKKFCLDLSYGAAHYLGVDLAEDRHVDIRIIGMPGEDPLPDDVDALLASGGSGAAPRTPTANR